MACVFVQDQFFSFSRCRVKYRRDDYCFDDPSHRFYQVCVCEP